MRILIVEDELTARTFLERVLVHYGTCDMAVDGAEGVDRFVAALDEGQPYDLICLDIMMPNKDGHQALREIREIEHQRGIAPNGEVKVIMTTALSDPKTVVKAYYEGGATAYLAKPIEVENLRKVLNGLKVCDTL